MTHCYGSLAESTPLQDWGKKIAVNRLPRTVFFHTKNRNFLLFSEIE